MKTATIVIPTFNRAHLVTRAIESAINQTYPCEVLVCDHGGTDNTPDVAARYHGKIRYIRREEDKGPLICWRDGIEQATGEIVHFTYDDDWIEPTFMEKTIAAMDDDVGFVYTNYLGYFPAKNRTAIGFRHPPGIGCMEDIVRYLIQAPFAISPGCAIFRKRDVLKNLLLEVPNACGIYGKDSPVGQDTLLFLLTSLDYPKYVHIREPLACFLAHPGSITINACLSGKKRDIVASYTNAKSHYFSVPGSILPPTNLQKLLFAFKWHYRSGTLAEVPWLFVKRILRDILYRFGWYR
jgi:glycosyltransferase involved in cell wall biosynthesis